MSLDVRTLTKRIDDAYCYFSHVGLKEKDDRKYIRSDLTLIPQPGYATRLLQFLVLGSRGLYSKEIPVARELLTKVEKRFQSNELKLRITFVKEVLSRIEERPDPGLAELKAINQLSTDFIANGIEPYKLYKSTLSLDAYPKCEQDAMANTPDIIVAVLRQDNKRLLTLLKKGVNVDSSDNLGYTAAHIAAIICSPSLLAILREHGARFNLLTIHGASVYDFLHYRGLSIKKTDSYFTGEALLLLWYYKVSGCEAAFRGPCLDFHYIRGLDKASTCSPVEVRIIMNQSSPLYGQKRVCASSNIDACTYLFDYTGVVRVKKSGSPYDFEMIKDVTVDASTSGSDARYINHGPPNCAIYCILYKGTPRLAVFTLREIKDGEELFIDYGPDYFLKRPFYELAPEAIDAFIAQYGLKKEEKKPIPELISEHVKQDYRRLFLDYLYHFPSHLLKRVEQGSLLEEDVQAFINNHK